MSITILISGALIFIVSLCVHILIWRRRHPKSHAVALLLIFIIVPVIIGMADWFAYRFLSKGFISVSIFNWLLILLLHFSLAAAYILSYPALQAVSPSLAMLLIIKSSMPHGLTYNEMRSSFTVDDLLDARLDDLKGGSLAVESEGWLRLTWRGLLLVKSMKLLRVLLGLPRGEG